jgi:glycosyltransferase involved in cell wall biosynthesis
VPPERIVPVIDGVDTDIFCPGPQLEGRNRLSIPLDIPVVAYLGVLNSYQGTGLLLDCVDMLKAEGTRVHFLIMGFPCERYKAEAEARGILDMITFTGKIDYRDAPQLLSAADIAVSPKLSPTEANGKLFNYMASGLPTVVFDNPVNHEILGDTGVYARNGDAGDLAAKIRDLLRDREARRLTAERVREKAINDHSWNARGKVLVETYRSVMGEK